MTGQIHMTKQEFIDNVLAGRPLILVEYRATETDTINRKVVKAGESATMPMVKHSVLVGNTSFEVAEFLPDGANLKDVKAPYKLRDMVVIEVETMEATKWGNRMTGTFHGKLN